MKFAVGVKWEKSRITIEANSSDQAKRKYCKMFGRKPSDYWCGLSIITASKIKE